MSAPETGYLTSFDAKFQIEGVDRDTALRIARTLRDRLEQEWNQMVLEAAEISAGGVGKAKRTLDRLGRPPRNDDGRGQPVRAGGVRRPMSGVVVDPTLTAGRLVMERATGRKGVLLNDHTAPVAVVRFDDLSGPTWADWQDLA